MAPEGAVVRLVAMTAETKELMARNRRMLNKCEIECVECH
jgi:cytochrome c